MNITGSCHCGTVRYESTGKVLRFANCHCDDCRKTNGSAYSAAIVVSSDGFRITAGENALTAYESSPGKHRCFCSRCGSPICSRMKAKPEIVILRAGTVDGDLAIRPEMHIFVKAKAPWYDIRDDLPQHPEWAPPK
jgi:hypothetical protein